MVCLNVADPTCAAKNIIGAKNAVGDAVGSAAESVVGGAFDKIAQNFAEAMGNTVKTLSTFWLNVPTPNVVSSNGAATGTTGFLWSSLSWYVGVAAVVSVLICAGQMMLTQRGRPLRELMYMFARLTLVSGAGVYGCSLAIIAADGFSVWIIDRATGKTFDENMGAVLGAAGMSPLGSALVLLAAIVAILASFVQMVMILVRSAVVPILLGVWPLAAGFSATKMGQGWFEKITAWLVAFILYKPAAAIVYAAAFRMMGEDSLIDSATLGEFGQALLNVALGLLAMGLAVIALPAIMRLVMPAVATMASGGGGGMAAGAAVGALASGAVNLGRMGASGGSSSTPSGSSPSSASGKGSGGGGGPGGGGSGGGAGVSRSAPGASGTAAGTASGGAGAAAAGGGATAAGAAAGPAGMAAGAAADAAGKAGAAVKSTAEGAAAGGGSETTAASGAASFAGEGTTANVPSASGAGPAGGAESAPTASGAAPASGGSDVAPASPPPASGARSRSAGQTVAAVAQGAARGARAGEAAQRQMTESEDGPSGSN